MANKKMLGLWMLTSLVVGNMVGSGIFLLPSALAEYGSISIFAWLFTSIGALAIAFVFARLSILLPKAGGPYAYCHEAFGGFIGFLIAYIFWIYSWVGNAAIATSLVSYLSYFYPAIAHNGILSYLLIIGMVWALTLLNILGVHKAGILQIITVLLKIIPLVILSLVGMTYLNPNHFLAFNMTNHSNFIALTGSATLTLWALTGVESATIPAEHVLNPERNIPLSTLLGTSVAIILYIAGTIMVMGIIPMEQLAISAAPFADAAKATIGPVAGSIIAVIAIISTIGALNGWIMLQGQIPYAASKNQSFPRFFAKLSKHHTPVNALIISSVLITLLLGMNYQKSIVDQFTAIISLATVTILFVYAMTMLAEIVILLKQNKLTAFYRKISVNILALIYILWALSGANQHMLYLSLFLVLSGIPLYWYTRMTRWSAASVSG
jgi:basic amino acid/polyamine antiporter, APA family